MKRTRTNVVAALALLLILVGCEAPPTVGEAGEIAVASADVVDAQAGVYASGGDTERAEKWRIVAETLREVGGKIDELVADGVIDENDAIEQIAPYLDDDETEALTLALGVAGRVARGEGVEPDSILEALQVAAPLVVPGYGVLAAGLIGVLRSFFRQRRATDTIVAGVDRYRRADPVSWNRESSLVADTLGDFGTAYVDASKRRNRIRTAKSENLAKSLAAKAEAIPG